MANMPELSGWMIVLVALELQGTEVRIEPHDLVILGLHT
jgi:hypothetical protein